MTYDRWMSILTPSTDGLVDILRRYHDTPMGEARALPLDLYTSEALLDLETERIFRREWICVGRSDQVAAVGDWFTTDIAGEPIIVTHGEDGRLRALSAVCRHRYMAVANGAGNSRRLVCPYHRWGYDLEGKLKGTPLMETPTSPSGETCRLPEFAIETWLGFVFVSLASDPAPLGPRLAGAADVLAPYGVEEWKTLIGFDEIWPGNWKLALETALEGYHVDGLHPGPIASMLPSRGSHFQEATEHWSVFRIDVDFTSELGAPTQPFAEAMGGVDAVSAPTVSLHPNVNLSFSPASTVWLTFTPVDVGHTRTQGGYLVPTSEYDRIMADEVELELTREAIAQLNREDASAMIDLQRNAKSRHAERGLLNEREEALVHFYRYLAGQLDLPDGGDSSGVEVSVVAAGASR